MCRTGGNQHKLHQAKLQNESNALKKRPANYTIIVNCLEADNKELIKQNTSLCNEVDRLK